MTSSLARQADVITYMRYGSFAASMTGNVIFAGRQIAQLAWQVSTKEGWKGKVSMAMGVPP